MKNLFQNPNVTLGDLLGEDFSCSNLLSISYPTIGKDNIQKFLDDGLINENDIQLNYDFLKYLQYTINQLEINLDNAEVIVLSPYTSLLVYSNNDEIQFTYSGLNGMYSKYVSTLIDSINKIDLLNIDVLNFELSDEKKIFSTQKNNVTDLKSNQNVFSVNEEDVINYLLHILPQYLPSNVNFHSSIMEILNDDEDDISVKFRDTLLEKSHQYLMNMKTKVNSIDLS